MIIVDTLNNGLTNTQLRSEPVEVTSSSFAARNTLSTYNNRSTTISAGATVTGGLEDVTAYSSVGVAVKTDQDGELYIEFSSDAGVTWDSSIPFTVKAGQNEVHRFTITRPYFRFRFTNTSAIDQTYFRLTTLLGSYANLTSALNSLVQQDADAIVSRSISDETLIAGGFLDGFQIVNKFGTNSDVDTASVPEDIWEGGGIYMGFPDSTLERIALSSTSALDTAAGTGARTVRITGLDANYNVQQEVITLNGTTPVSSVNTYRRMHTMTVISAGSLGVNQGDITATHVTTTTNVFATILAGRNQSNCSAYTIPAGYTGYMRFLHSAMAIGTTSANAEGLIWTRSFGNPFRSRRPYLMSNTFRVQDDIFGGLVFTEKSDIILRISAVSNNNTKVNGGYDLILVRN